MPMIPVSCDAACVRYERPKESRSHAPASLLTAIALRCSLSCAHRVRGLAPALSQPLLLCASKLRTQPLCRSAHTRTTADTHRACCGEAPTTEQSRTAQRRCKRALPIQTLFRALRCHATMLVQRDEPGLLSLPVQDATAVRARAEPRLCAVPDSAERDTRGPSAPDHPDAQPRSERKSATPMERLREHTATRAMNRTERVGFSSHRDCVCSLLLCSSLIAARSTALQPFFCDDSVCSPVPSCVIAPSSYPLLSFSRPCRTAGAPSNPIQVSAATQA